MASHNELGAEGEKLAEAWLIEKGFDIVYRNWRYGRYEIDIIASKQGTIHFIEVKCLKACERFPEDKVTKRKFKNIQQAADHFLALNAGHDWVQYDILAITVYDNRKPEYYLLEDVFL